MRRWVTAVCVLLVMVSTVDASAHHRARRHRRHKHDAAKVVRMKHGNVNVLEADLGQETFGIPVVVDPGTAGTTVSVDYEIVPVDATRGADFAHDAGLQTLTFGADQHEAEIPVKIQGDLIDEANETIRIDLYNVRCTGAGSCDINSSRNALPGYVTIVDDEGRPSGPDIKVKDDLIDDGEELCDIEVKLDRGSGETVKVDFATKNGTATAGDDYTKKSGTVTFSPGQITKEVEIALKPRRDGEARDAFTVEFSNARGGNLTDDTAVCRFADAGRRADVDDD